MVVKAGVMPYSTSFSLLQFVKSSATLSVVTVWTLWRGDWDYYWRVRHPSQEIATSRTRGLKMVPKSMEVL